MFLYSLVRTLFSIATEYISLNSILRLWRSQTLFLSISELEQNLHDCRQLPFTWTLLEVVTKVLTTLSLVCFSATNSEPLNRPRISLHEEEEHLVITPIPSKTAPNRNRQLQKEVTKTLRKDPPTEPKNDRRKTPITNPNSRRKTHSTKNPNDRKTLVKNQNRQQ